MKTKTKFTWSEGEYNEQGDAMHSDQCRQSTGSKCICPPLKQERSDVSASEHTPTPWHVGMRPGPMVYGQLGEQIADCRGLDESGQNALLIVRAVNAYEKDQEMVKELVKALEKSAKSMKQLCEMVNSYSIKLGQGKKVNAEDWIDIAMGRALAKAEGKGE